MKNDRWYTSVELAEEIRETLKKEFPQCKFNVSKKDFAGGRTITVRLMAAPFPALIGYAHSTRLWDGAPAIPTCLQVNPNQLRKEEGDYYREGKGFVNNGLLISREARDLMQRVNEIANVHNWDNSDIQSDYLSVNYYVHLEIGYSDDRPFVNTAAKKGVDREIERGAARV